MAVQTAFLLLLSKAFGKKLFDPDNFIVAGAAVGKVGMADEFDVPCKIGIGLLVAYAKNLAQAADAVVSKHFHIHTF